jgi:predicted metal-dependent peptidase
VSLMRDPKFALFAGLFMVGKITIVESEHYTASTNGRDAKYGRTFVDSLTDKELAFLIMHENMHKCYRHLTTWRKLWEVNAGIANNACDFVINIQLVDMDPNETCLAFPRDKKSGDRIGCFDERFRGMDAKQVFDILMEENGEDEGDDEGEARRAATAEQEGERERRVDREAGQRAQQRWCSGGAAEQQAGRGRELEERDPDDDDDGAGGRVRRRRGAGSVSGRGR